MIAVQKYQFSVLKIKTYIVQSESIDRVEFRCSEFTGLRPHMTGKKNDLAFYEKGPRSCSKTVMLKSGIFYDQLPFSHPCHIEC